MAIKALNSTIVENYQVRNNQSPVIHAGSLVVYDTDNTLKLADRSVGIGTTQRYLILGLAADDASSTGNTFIQADPVGSAFLGVGQTLLSYANQYYVGAKRAIGDFQNESINVVTNLTAGSNTSNTSQRGVGVYLAPGQFLTDQINLSAVTSTATADVAGTVAIGNPLTVGSSGLGNTGLLVGLANWAHGPVVARCDDILDTVNNLALVTLL